MERDVEEGLTDGSWHGVRCALQLVSMVLTR